MHEPRRRANEALTALVSAWLTGDADAAIGAYATDVRWWTPFTDSYVEGRADTWAALEAVFARTPHLYEVTALIVDEDGTSGVVEMRAAPTASHRPYQLVTSVIRFSEGVVVEGLTYSDIGAEEASAQR